MRTKNGRIFFAHKKNLIMGGEGRIAVQFHNFYFFYNGYSYVDLDGIYVYLSWEGTYPTKIEPKKVGRTEERRVGKRGCGSDGARGSRCLYSKKKNYRTMI